jgi:hypothetical protein
MVAPHAYLSSSFRLIFLDSVTHARFHSWFWPHAIVNFLLTGPLIFAAFALGYQTTTASGLPHFTDPHQVSQRHLAILLPQTFLFAPDSHLLSFFFGYRKSA